MSCSTLLCVPLRARYNARLAKHALRPAGFSKARLLSPLHRRLHPCCAWTEAYSIAPGIQELKAAYMTHGCTAAMLLMPRESGAVPSASSTLPTVPIRTDACSILCVRQCFLTGATCALPESQDESAYDELLAVTVCTHLRSDKQRELCMSSLRRELLCQCRVLHTVGYSTGPRAQEE